MGYSGSRFQTVVLRTSCWKWTGAQFRALVPIIAASLVSLKRTSTVGAQGGEQFGFEQMRVVTITNSRERMHNMVSVVRSITEGRGSNFFLFVDQENLAAADPLSVEWLTGKERRIRLGD
jgi:hypothetical protein